MPLDFAYAPWDNVLVFPPLLDMRLPSQRVRPAFIGSHTNKASTSDGYEVEIERRLEGGRATAIARLTAPDGRVLNVCWVPSMNRTAKPQLLVEDLTCAAVAKIFGRVTPAQDADASRRLSAAFEAGLQALTNGHDGPEALNSLREAVLCVSDEEVEAYNAHMSGLTINRFLVAKLRDHSIPPKFARDFVARYREDTAEWLLRYPEDGEYAAYGRFAAFDWSPEDYRLFVEVWTRVKRLGTFAGANGPQERWGIFPASVASLGLAAGMTVTEVHGLVTDGAWDEDAVGILAAFAMPA